MKKYNQKNSTGTLVNLSEAWKEKMAKTTNHQAFEGCFRVQFNRYLKERKYSASINFVEDIVLEQARQCLEARSKEDKELKREGKGNKPNAAEPLTDVEENILYEKIILGISNAKALLDTV